MKQYTLDANARLEFGFRIQSTQASYRELESLLGADAKVNWARTQAHPNRTKFFAIPAELDQNGRLEVPDHVVDAFTRHGGLMMVKLVTPLPSGHYANLAKKTDDGMGKLWEFDGVSPQRDNGDWVYSMPIHGLEKAGEGFRFFFVIRLDRVDATQLTLTVDRVTITRGKTHFTVTRKTYGPFPPASDVNLVGIAQKYTERDGDHDIRPLRDLPLAAAIAEARAR